jgi:CorA-like Mg2+ transporter protein
MHTHQAKPATEEAVDWSKDDYWKTRLLSPNQIWIHDVRLTDNPFHMQSVGPWIEIIECLNSSLIPDLENRDALYKRIKQEPLTPNRVEQQRLENLADNFGWMNCLRSKGVQQHIGDDPQLRKCRWIHISSKFPEYLQGCLLALSDWEANTSAEIYASMRQLDQCVQHNERFSKHGRYFNPFVEFLAGPKNGGPILMSVPFLDWTVNGATPPLRFHVDRREQWKTSTRSSAHPVRSVLQHFYRLEDTSEREHLQVHSKHKPWVTDPSLDLKVRRWYGQYPSSLNVDELWILVIDERHIVSFSSNQTWKSRWPPLQVASRIMEISFRELRNGISMSEVPADYNSFTHIVACLSGAVGLLHRSFWPDLPLCLTDRYAGYLSHLQYRLLRSPSTKLVMDLLQVQEELNIIISILQQQLDLIENLYQEYNTDGRESRSAAHSRSSSAAPHGVSLPPFVFPASAIARPAFKNYAPSTLREPMQQLADNLRREFTDLGQLRDNANNLINRTIQLVNIRLEDHGKAVLVFTIITIIFLPLSFVASVFGMNTIDIRQMTSSQSLFWIVAVSLTVGVVAFSVLVAFYGGDAMEAFVMWKANRADRKRDRADSY